MKKLSKICLVDDDSVFLYIAENTIKKANCVNNIQSFTSGLNALKYLHKEKNNLKELPEILFLDVSMPVMDGWEFLDQFKLLVPQLDRKIIIYVLSSSISPADVKKAWSYSSVSDYLVKPLTADKFVELVKSTMLLD